MTAGRRITAAIALAGLCTFVGVSPSQAQGAETGISVIIDSPPSLASSLDARLLRGGTDITDTACEPITDSSPPLPGITCRDLPDGTYAVEVSGAPGDAVEVWDCSDITASPTEPTSILIGRGFTEWICGVAVSPPGVVITPTSTFDDRGRIPTLDVVVRDAGGDVVSASCEVDDRGDDPAREWCTPLAAGTYTVTPLDVPDGMAASAFCAPFFFGAPLFGGFEITDDDPLWSCERPGAFEPLVVNFTWVGATGRDRAWFDDLAITLTDADGTDVSDSCTQSNGNDDPFEPFIEWACTAAFPADYTASFAGVPSDFEVDSGCDPVSVPANPSEPAFCSYEVRSEPIIEPPDTTTPDEPDVLPETGTASSRAALLGALLLVAGVAVLRTSRRGGVSR